MNHDELKELIYFLSQKDISEFSIERAGSSVRIKRNIESQLAAPSARVTLNAREAETVSVVVAANDGSPSQTAAAAEEELHIVKSPTVGIFQRGPAPGGRPFVSEGDTVEAGQVVGMIEVLRIMHEVKSDVSGRVIEAAANDREPVEYGQALFAVYPNKPN